MSSITLTAASVGELRTLAGEMFPGLVSTVPVNQSPGLLAKGDIELAEALRATTAERDEAQALIAKLETAYKALADMKAPDPRFSDEPSALGAVAAACDVLGSPRDINALPALVQEVKDERDKALAALGEAQAALEGAQAELVKLRAVVGTPAATKSKAKKVDAALPVGSLGALTPESYPAPSPMTINGIPSGPDTPELVSKFALLPTLTTAAIGDHVLIYEHDDVAIKEGWIDRQFEGVDRWQVRLKRGGMVVGTLDHVRAWVDGYDNTPRDFTEEVMQARRAEAAVADAPALPGLTDAIADRLITVEERTELGAYAKSLALSGPEMLALMERLFKKQASAELTVTELATLRTEMLLEAQVPF